jgi:hypothetical protein
MITIRITIMAIERKKPNTTTNSKIEMTRQDKTRLDFGKRLHAYHSIWSPNEQFRLLA